MKKFAIQAALATLILSLLTVLGWVGSEIWTYWHRPASYLWASYEKVEPGMSLAQVDSFFGTPGRKIDESQVTQVVDFSQPVDSPKRLKPVISGESFYQWSSNDGAYVIVSVKKDTVSEKFFHDYSL